MRSRRAFSLAELVIAMSAGAAVIIATLLIFSTLMVQWGGQISRSEDIRTANLVIDQISKDMRQGISLQTTADAYGRVNQVIQPANTDVNGNYVPAWSNGKLSYQAGTEVHYYLSNTSGTFGVTGNCLWREYLQVGGSWTADTAWTMLPGSMTAPRFQNISSLTFSIPATNVVRITVTVSETINNVSRTYTQYRDVYLYNHN